jgi:hypothetical protein
MAAGVGARILSAASPENLANLIAAKKKYARAALHSFSLWEKLCSHLSPVRSNQHGRDARKAPLTRMSRKKRERTSRANTRTLRASMQR